MNGAQDAAAVVTDVETATGAVGGPEAAGVTAPATAEWPSRRDRRERGPGSPVLDIGGEVGALVVLLATEPPGGELEACPVGRPDARFHTGVHHRSTGREWAWTAVFPEVTEGAYHLLDPEGVPLADVTVAGGDVGHLDLR